MSEIGRFMANARQVDKQTPFRAHIEFQVLMLCADFVNRLSIEAKSTISVKNFYICGFANGAYLRNVWPFQGSENSLRET